jgi:hypothetical protein
MVALRVVFQAFYTFPKALESFKFSFQSKVLAKDLKA